MKNELLRFQDMCFRARGQKYGPFFFQLFEGELTGILTDDFFDNEVLVDFFCGKVQSMKGFFYLRENLIPAEEQQKTLRKINSECISMISERSRLFEALSIAENILFPHFLLRTGKLDKIAGELSHFFQLDIPLGRRVNQLSPLERIEIELLHAVAHRRRVVIVSDVNKLLRDADIICLNRLYRQMVHMGFTICLIEPLTDVTMEMMNHFSLIKGTKTVGSGYRGEYTYQEAFRLLNTENRVEEYKSLLQKKDRRYYRAQDAEILRCEGISGKRFRNLSFSLRQGEIGEIVCRRHSGYVELTGMLAGDASPAAGTLSFMGEKAPPQMLRENLKKWRIGCVDMSVNMLFANRSVLENICCPLSLKTPFFYLHRKYMRAARDYILDIAGEVDLQADVASLPSEQVLWISICKWMLCKPQLLLFFITAASGMDNLDIVTERLLVELGMHGVPVLLVTEQHGVGSEIVDWESTV